MAPQARLKGWTVICLTAALLLTSLFSRVPTAGATTVVATTATVSSTCPFCASINLTFSDQIAAKDVVVAAKLIKTPELSDDPDAALPRASFEITDVIKGKAILEVGMEFQALLVGRYKPGKVFLVMGIAPPKIIWTTPIAATPVLLKYLDDIQKLPDSGPRRLTFFQDYFEHEISAIAFDAYDEFAKAPYADLLAMKDKMDRDQLLSWIQSPDTSINRRRLYLTMLGVCGTTEDAQTLEKLIEAGGDVNLRGMDALVACYLNLKGDAGVDLIEEKFLANVDCEFTTTMGAVSALRFHGTEVENISKERIIAAIRRLLDRPKMADLIIADLARWEDWSVTDKLVEMFKESKKDNRWLRVPIVSFLMESPEQRAKDYLKELGKIDPGAIERAKLFGRGFDDSDAEPEDEEIDQDEDPADNADPNKESSQSSLSPPSQRYTSRKVPMMAQDKDNRAPKPITTEPQETASQVASSTVIATVGESQSARPLTAPLASAVPYLTLKIILIPFVCSIALFLLLWSVVSGSFQRLIC